MEGRAEKKSEEVFYQGNRGVKGGVFGKGIGLDEEVRFRGMPWSVTRI